MIAIIINIKQTLILFMNTYILEALVSLTMILDRYDKIYKNKLTKYNNRYSIKIKLKRFLKI